MKIGYITNSPAPYRIQQINKFCELEKLRFKIYYTNKSGSRTWEIEDKCIADEVFLKEYVLFKYSNFDFSINPGLKKIVKENDLIIIGGYEQFSYFIVSLLCRLFKKKYILLFDGIQPQKIGTKTNLIKNLVIRTIIGKSEAIFANGTVSKLYFSKNFGYDVKKIYNQYLTIDIDKIDQIYRDKCNVRKEMIDKYHSDRNKNILICVSRLLDLKNVQLLLNAVGLLDDKDNYIIFIVGDGPERLNLERIASELGLSVIFTGNITNPIEVYKHYMIADLFVFPTTHEAWGLVVNEAMAAGLPILCSKGAGASMDLVVNDQNGFTFDPNDPVELSYRIKDVFSSKEKLIDFGKQSKEMIGEWSFDNSKNSFINMLNQHKIL